MDKLEQERSQLKMDNDRLEQRVSSKFFKLFDHVFFTLEYLPFSNWSLAKRI